MRVMIVSSLLIVGSGLGCYVQPYNPPPAQYGQVQPQPGPPPPQSQPQPQLYDQQPAYDQQPGYAPPPAEQQPPVAQPAPLPAPPPSQPIYRGPSYDDVNVDVAGSNVPSVDVFYNDLAPYGSWYNDSTYGWVFAPSSTSYVPYSNGHWAYTDYGYTWVSADPFGWATDHYGRWVWANGWVWRPDTTWGPAWVQWRQGDGYVGWAPAGYTDDAYVPDNAWRFVGAASLFSPDVRRFYVTANVGAYLRGATPVSVTGATATRPGSLVPTTTGCAATGCSRGVSVWIPLSSADSTTSSGARLNSARTSTRATGTRGGGKTTSSGATCLPVSSGRTRRECSRRKSSAA